jgi:hypothetical protein
MNVVALEREAEALVDAWQAARRAYGEFRRPPSPTVQIDCSPAGLVVREILCPVANDVWIWRRLLLPMGMEAAWGDLWSFVSENDPIDDQGGIYKLDGLGELTYRRHCRPGFPWRPSEN